MTDIRLGVNNGFAAKRWPEPMTWTRLIAEELGLTEVQFSFDLLDPLLPEPGRTQYVEATRTAALHHGLNLRTTFTGAVAYGQSLLGHPDESVRNHAARWFEEAVIVTEQLGSSATGGHMGAISADTMHHNASRVQAVRRLTESVVQVARLGAIHGLEYILWELMPSALEPPHRPSEAVSILTDVNLAAPIPVRLCLDLGHCCAPELPSPGDPETWLRQLLPWVRMVHLQQTDGKDDHHWAFSRRHQGIIKPKSIVDIAREADESIDLIFEFVHPMTVPHNLVIDDYKDSIQVWGELL